MAEGGGQDLPRTCAHRGCERKRVLHSRWCDKHRYTANREEGAEPKPKHPHARPSASDEAEVRRRVRDMARAASVESTERLIAAMRSSNPSASVAASRLVLGLAGISATPDQKVKHEHKGSALPPGVSIAALVQVVRHGALGPGRDAMARFDSPPANPARRANLAPHPPNGSSQAGADAQTGEIIDVQAVQVGGEGVTSGAQPEEPAGEEGA